VSGTEQKSVPFELAELKASSDGGWEIWGFASTYGGNPDSYGDVVVHGAFRESLGKRKTKLLYQHQEPIGRELELREEKHGLYGGWRISATRAGTDARTLAMDGVLDSLSIGFRTLEDEYRDDGVRLLKQAELYEVSIVAFPANENARITSVKTDVPFKALLEQVTPFYKDIPRAVEALWERRATERREPTEAHVLALDEAIAEAEAYTARLKRLREPAAQVRAGADLSARLRHARWELSQGMAARRKRLAAVGILESVS
jgi:HK97 family phage prohead protease